LAIGPQRPDPLDIWTCFLSLRLSMHPQTQSKRLFSLDAFRGLTIAAMILVNTPGTHSAIYPQLKHAEWNGWTFADCVFPFFLFIVGVSIVFSFSKRKERGDTDAKLEQQVAKRTLIIFGLGLFLNGFPIFHLSTLRIPGVLQRIALCYFFASLIVLRTSLKTLPYWLAGLLAAYWLMMEFIPVPGIGAGVYEPGRNFAAYIDSLFLAGHTWARCEAWDPEGLVSTIPAIASTLFGVLTGYWLRSSHSTEKKTVAMLAAGLALLLLGRALGIWLPINKNLWTSSFSIFMAGWALCCLATLYWIIDVKQCKRWAIPFLVLGMNSISIYVLSEVLDTSLRFISIPSGSGLSVNLREYIYERFFQPFASPINASLLFAISFVVLMFLVAWIMWKRNWFVKI